MYKTELKAELKTIFDSNKNIDKELVNIKVAIHNLEKLGCNTRDLEELIDSVGIEFYKFKNESREIMKDWR